MIKLDSVIREDEDGLMVGLLSDTKEETIAMGKITKNVSGINDDIELGMGSTCFTAKQELLILDSNGQWN